MNGPGSTLGLRRTIRPLAGLGRGRMAPCVRRGCRAVGLASLVALCTGGSRAWASLADLLKEPQFNHLELAPIAPALAATVVSTYPRRVGEFDRQKTVQRRRVGLLRGCDIHQRRRSRPPAEPPAG